METIDNLRFLALHSAFPWLSAAFFSLLGLWFGHLLWFDWVRQLRPLRAEHRELSRRLEGLQAAAKAPEVAEVKEQPAPPPAPVAVPEAPPAPVAEEPPAPAPAPAVAELPAPPRPVPAGTSGEALSAEFWPIPEKAPAATVITGEVVPDKVREAAAMLVGISLGPDTPGIGKEG
jgi:hypothetical protein